MEKFKRLWRGYLWRFIMSHWPLCLFTLSLSIRLLALTGKRFWYDEAFTAMIADLSPFRAMQAVAGDVHPPLWYFISWITARLIGTGELAQRLPSALFGSLSCVLLYKIVRPLGKNEGMIVSGLLAILPAQIAYSQEARMYSLLSCLVLFAVYSIMRGRWMAAITALVLLMYTHNLACVYVLPLGVWSLLKGKKQAMKYLPICLAYLPWLVVTWHQVQSVNSAFWIADPGNIGGALHYIGFSTLYLLPDWAQWHGAICSILLTCYAIWILRADLKKLWHLIMVAILPSAEMYGISLAWRPIMLDRALVPSGAFLAALWAIAWTRCNRLQRAILGSIGVPMLVLSFSFYFLDSVIIKPDYTDIIDQVMEEWKPGDVMYHNSLGSVILFDRHLPDDLPNYILPNVGDLSQSLSEPTKQAMGIKQREATAAQLATMGYKRLWLMYIDSPVTSDYEHDRALQLWNSYYEIEVWPIGSDEYSEFSIVQLDLTRKLSRSLVSRLQHGRIRSRRSDN